MQTPVQHWEEQGQSCPVSSQLSLPSPPASTLCFFSANGPALDQRGHRAPVTCRGTVSPWEAPVSSASRSPSLLAQLLLPSTLPWLPSPLPPPFAWPPGDISYKQLLQDQFHLLFLLPPLSSVLVSCQLPVQALNAAALRGPDLWALSLLTAAGILIRRSWGSRSACS